MDKLQWFKFTPSDWMMGKIQRCPEVTQARFMRLCCLYWNKECNLSFEDAEIEIDKEHIDILIKKKIVSNISDFINIGYLDEQYAEIVENNKNKSTSGIIGNLKRWHKDIYNRYSIKEITLEEAVLLSKSIADQSHTDSNPISEQSQSIADKIREEKKREDTITSAKADGIDFKQLLSFINKTLNKNFRTINSSLQAKYKARLKDGYTKEDIQKAIIGASKSSYHLETNYRHLRPEFFSRADKIDMYSNTGTIPNKNLSIKERTAHITNNINKTL